MTNISKQPLKKELRDTLMSQLCEVCLQAGEKKLPVVLSALLSPSEQVMLIKRVAIVMLLHKDKSTYFISKHLLVSDHTVRVVKKEVEAGRYDPLLGLVRSNQFDQTKFWEALENILTLGMPRYGTSLNQMLKSK